MRHLYMFMKKKNEICISMAICVFLVLVYNVFFEVRFETDDDPAMASILYGEYGVSRPELVYINVLLGYGLRFLLKLSDTLPWYSLVQYAVLCCSSTVILYLIIKKHGIVRSLIPITVFVLFFSDEYLGIVQFTKTAGLACLAGFFLILFAAIEKWKHHLYILGIALVFLGCWYRFLCYEMILVLLLGCVIVCFYNCYLKNNGIKGLTISLVIVVCFCGLFRIIDTQHYSSDKELKSYIAYNSLRAQLTDYGWPDYDENKVLYQRLGISGEDLEMFRHWDFNDPDVVNVDSMKELVEVKEKTRINSDWLKQFIFDGLTKLKNRNYIYGLLIIVCFYIFSKKNNTKAGGILLLLEGFLFLGCFMYLFFIGRMHVNHVNVLIYTAVFLVVVLFCNDKTFPMPKGIALYVILGMMIISPFLNGLSNHNNRIDSEKVVVNGLKNYFALHKDNLYLIGTIVLQQDYYRFWDRVDYASLENVCQLGGWRTEYPITNDVLHQHSVNNPFRDCVNRADVYIVTNCNDGRIERYTNYIKNHYYPDAYSELEDSISGSYFVYRMRY